MADPSQLASRWLAGATLTADQLDLTADRIPLLRPNGTEAQISPEEFYLAVTAEGGSHILLRSGNFLIARSGVFITPTL